MRFNPSRQSYGSTVPGFAKPEAETGEFHVIGACGPAPGPCRPGEVRTGQKLQCWGPCDDTSRFARIGEEHEGETLAEEMARFQALNPPATPSETFIRGFFGGLITLPEEYAKPAKYAILGLAAYGAIGLVRRML